MAERNVSLIEDSITGLKTSNGIKISSVTGGTSTDNAIVRFDGTTGNVQNSGVTIDDSNNVGIGNINPDNAISVYSNPLLYAGENYRSNITLYDSSTVGAGVGGGIGFGGNYIGTSNKTTFATISVAKDNSSTSDFGASLIFKTRGAVTAPIEKMRIDSAGNVGIGVTPSTWGSTWKSLDLLSSSITSYTTLTDPYTIISNNAYISGNSSTLSSVYKNNGGANSYNQGGGVHIWRTAPSGTAGSPITWTTAMTLDSNGVLNVTSTPTNGRINIGASSNYIYGNTSGNFIIGTGNTDIVNITSNGILVGNSNTGQKCIGVNHETGVIQSYQHNTTMNIPLILNPASGGGNLLVGTTIDNGVDKLQVNGGIKSGGFTTKILTVASGSTLDIDGTMSNGYSFIGMVSIGIVDTIAPSSTSLTNLVYNVLNYYGYSPSVSLINQIGTCANVSVTWVSAGSNKYVFRIVNSRATAITIKYTAM